MKKIFLDMDGVCTNFIDSCIRANGFDTETVIDLWKKKYLGEFRAYKVLGISNSTFWKNIEKLGENFWTEMDEYIYFNELYKSLKAIGEVYFLTSPSQSPFSLSGKLIWLQQRFGKNFKDYVITPNKGLLADNNSYLIDDYPENILKFNKAGGKGILFNQFWNSKIIINDKVQDVISKIEG